MLIYTPKITSRTEYTFNLIFDTIWDIEHKLTDDVEFFKENVGNKLNYSSKKIDDEFFIKIRIQLTVFLEIAFFNFQPVFEKAAHFPFGCRVIKHALNLNKNLFPGIQLILCCSIHELLVGHGIPQK